MKMDDEVTLPSLQIYDQMTLPRELWNFPRVEIDQYTAVPLACNGCFGTFRGRTVGEPCPGCGAASVPADQALPRPEISDVPEAFLSDERLKRLRGRQWGLPAELRAIENLLTDLRARRKAAVTALADVRIRLDLKVASQRDLDEAEDAIAEYDSQIKRAEDKLDETVSVQRSLNAQIERIVGELRQATAPEVVAAARKFAAEVLPHIEAIERAATKAKDVAGHYRPIFERLTGVGHSSPINGTGVPLGVLEYFEQNASSQATRLKAITSFANLAARLPK